LSPGPEEPPLDRSSLAELVIEDAAILLTVAKLGM
jgi:hypothetical protein